MSPEPGVERLSVLRLDGVLIAAIQQELTDQTALDLQRDLTEMGAVPGTRGVIIEISGVEIVDSFLARVLAEIAAAASLLAGRTVVAGMRPPVAITLVEMGLGLSGMQTARSLEDAMAFFDDSRDRR